MRADVHPVANSWTDRFLGPWSPAQLWSAFALAAQVTGKRLGAMRRDEENPLFWLIAATARPSMESSLEKLSFAHGGLEETKCLRQGAQSHSCP